MRILITPGQARDDPQPLLLPLPDGIRAAPRTWWVTFTCPERADRIAHRADLGPRGGRPPDVDDERYEQRNAVERCFVPPQTVLRLATRYATRAAYYQAELAIAAIVLWLRQRIAGRLAVLSWEVVGGSTRSRMMLE